jgi:aldehyde dehydrogenase (NAD+)
VALLTETWSGLQVGPGNAEGTVVGPLVNEAQLRKVAGYVRQGLEEGAVRATPDRQVPEGLYFAPTILDHVTRNMAVAREEIFGPVLTITRVKDVNEAIDLVNDTDYGLAAAVFSENLEVAMRVGREARAGMIHINHGTVSQPHVPFGGVKESGLGAFSIGLTNADFFTQTKVVYLKPNSGSQPGQPLPGHPGPAANRPIDPA